ncbi:MAG: alpha/beta fold hydrolase [Thermodesulfobacteriota bacterium]
MPFIALRGQQAYYEDYGQGPLVILLHHGFGSCEMWRGILPHLATAGYRVVMYDRRGYGRSHEGGDYRDFYLSEGFRPAMVDELAALAAALDLPEFHLVGQCEGGVLALDYAARFPGQVKSLVVASTLCHHNGDIRAFNLQKFPVAFADLDEKIRRKMIAWHGEANAERRFELFRYMGGAYGTGQFDLRPMLPGIGQPTLIIYPDRSALFEVEQAVDFYRGLPNAELAVMPKCGHNTYEQKPQEYLRLVQDFLGRQERGEESAKSFIMTCAG